MRQKVLQAFRKVHYQECIFLTISFFGFSSKQDTVSLLHVQLSICIISILRKLLRSLDLVVIVLESSLLVKGLWLLRACFSSHRACLFDVSNPRSQNFWKLPTLFTRFTFDQYCNKFALSFCLKIIFMTYKRLVDWLKFFIIFSNNSQINQMKTRQTCF